MSNLLPSVGAKGTYRLAHPFDILIKDVTYTCIAVRRLSDFVMKGADPKVLYYDKNGLDDAIWVRDSKDTEVCIITLKSDSGQSIDVPSTYLLSYPNLNGVPYTARVLGISLGAIPDDMDLSHLYTQMSNLVRDVIGIDSTVKSVAISDTTLITKEDHDTYEVARLELIQSSQTERSRVIELEALVNKLKQNNQALEEYINELI